MQEQIWRISGCFGGPSLNEFFAQIQNISSIKKLDGAYIYCSSSSLGKVGLLKDKNIETLILGYNAWVDDITSVDATELELGDSLKEFTLTSNIKLNIQNMPSSLCGNQVVGGGPALTSLTFTGTSL